MFDGTLGDWDTDPVDLELNPVSKPFHNKYYPVPIDETPSTTREREESGADGVNEAMMHRPRMVAPTRPQRGMAAGDGSAGPQLHQSIGANGALPKNGTHLPRTYGILAPEELEGG